ncbi:MAG: helix-turn-helix domain-containing protein [Dermatophilus congolensis]|nr:helix-turn-helix domain-containing protein [Dermatophilus congolensis]
MPRKSAPVAESKRAVVHVSAREVEACHRSLQEARGKGRALYFVTERGTRVAVPPEVSDLLERVMLGAVTGKPLRVEPLPEQLTTTQAADLLGISRPTLMKRIREGEFVATKVGTHHRLATRDVIAARIRAEQRERRAAVQVLQRGAGAIVNRP